MSHIPDPPRAARPGDIVLVVHDFAARTEDELNLKRGDKVELLELDEGFEDGWYLGRHLTGHETGLFPGVYTTSTPKISFKDAGIKGSSNPSADTFKNSEHVSDKNDAATLGLTKVSTPQLSSHVNSNSGDVDLLELDSHGHSRSSSDTSHSRTPEIQRTISETIVTHLNGEESPGINETLSVIDEHITNFSTPRQSVVVQDSHRVNDSSSEYSSHAGNRLSYIRGTETDEEEERRYSEADVRRWNHDEVAERLHSLGVDAKHCQIFREQEISGDVLLEMDQEFIYMKDFDFGVMGRRLKTWHIIKAFQEEIRGTPQPRSMSSYSGRGSSPAELDRSQSRSGTATPFLPRIPSVSESPRPLNRQSRGATFSSYQSRTGPSPVPVTSFNRPKTRDSVSRPSADLIRQSNYHRRNSSIDEASKSATSSMKPVSNIPAMSSQLSAPPQSQTTLMDRSWSIRAVPELRPATAKGLAPSQGQDHVNRVSGTQTTTTDESPDLDRGYFSGGDVETRKSRRFLRKRESGGRSMSQSRQSGGAEKKRHNRTHSRFSSVDSFKDFAPYFSSFGKSNHPSSTSQEMSNRRELLEDESHSPPITNLEEANSGSGFFSSISSFNSKSREDSPSQAKGMAPKFRRAAGLRAISDAVTGTEKLQFISTASSPIKDHPTSPTRTDSTTPSGTSKSFELEGGDGTDTSKLSDLGVSTPASKTPSQRTKSKRDTSAYIRGLEKKSPQEQKIGCDYYGWMKKKSSNLMTTWKPRLFILRGRRLSYYYSEDDTEERGLIDISSHRVFRADNDTITSLHATITGAKALPSSPTNASGSQPKTPDSDRAPEPKKNNIDQPFIFKLVPPKAGLSRAVQFTKPAVHYFQVDNIQLGRAWMAALMKATIERDINLPIKTTNKQKTISLKQARQMNQRPPALMNRKSRDGLKETLQDDSHNDAKLPEDPEKPENPESPDPLEPVNTTSSSLYPDAPPSRSYSSS